MKAATKIWQARFRFGLMRSLSTPPNPNQASVEQLAASADRAEKYKKYLQTTGTSRYK